MKLDIVHDIQTAYRKVIDSMARPGTIADLSEEAGKLEQTEYCLNSTLVLAQMLLDTEVSFKVVSASKAQAADQFGQLTYAKQAEAGEADYIFVLRDTVPDDLLRAIEEAKTGELADPHFSATLIIETDSLIGGTKLRLTGPGIQSAASAEPLLRESWVDARAERNAEFPLGLDMIFVDAEHRLLALPRTTQIAREEA